MIHNFSVEAFAQYQAITTWKQKHFGVKIDWESPIDDLLQCGSDWLVDLCFADDETLVARNVTDLQDMLNDVVRDLAKVGLRVTVVLLKMNGWGECWRILAVMVGWDDCSTQKVNNTFGIHHAL